MRWDEKTPVLPCWYCEGRGDGGEEFDPKYMTGWGCEACDERRDTRAREQRLLELLREAKAALEWAVDVADNDLYGNEDPEKGAPLTCVAIALARIDAELKESEG